MQTTRHSPLRRFLAAVVAFALATAPVAPGAYAATTLLTDQPIAAKVAAKPNIIFTLDDSGSMALDYIPDYVTGTNPINTPPGYCRHTNGTTNQACGVSSGLAAMNPGYDEPMFASEFNRLHYNPNINYDPPVDGNGNQANAAFPNGACGPNFTSSCSTVFKMMNATNTVNWTRVPRDMYLTLPSSLPLPATPTSAFTNLATTVAMPVFCNTDWPRDNPVNLASVGNTYGEYSATAGADCRINGTSYDAIDSSPVINISGGDTGYNYPWQKSSGANDPKYYYRNGGISSSYANRYIWCKTSAAGWPKDPNNLAGCGSYTCTMGGTPVIPSSVAQTCNAGSTVQGPPWTYTPTGCEADPVTYQFSWGGGCVGTVGVECLACSRSGIIVTRNATCSITGVACGTTGTPAPAITVNGNPACPNQPGTVPTSCTVGTLVPPAPCNPLANANCNMTYGGTGGTGGTTLLNDANGAGVTCRRNNMTGTYVSNRFTYPETPANSSTYSKAVNDSSCGSIISTIAIPRYYYTAASVEFCNKQIVQSGASATTVVSANDQWRGFGAGTCQAKNDQTTYKFVKYGQMKRVGLVNDGRTYAYTDPFTGVAGTRTYAEEMTNYANWFAYYRTRVLTAKTTTAIAFNNVDKTYRAGFHTMNLRLPVGSPTTADWLDIADFTTANRPTWYNKLFATSIVSGMQTPTLDAMIRIGEVVKNGAGAVTGLPTHADPFPTNPATGNPVTCTNNYHVLFTDGETNQPTLPTVAGEVDGAAMPARVVNGTLPPDPNILVYPERTLAGLTATANWPNPYKDVASPTANTLADVSLYYWMQDLRPTLENNVPSSDGRAGRDLDWKRNPAWWQHVSFSALSYGSDGLLDSTDVTAKTDQIAAGTVPWFTAPNYPRPPNRPNNPAQSPATRPASAIDDLWHATVNSRGTFAYAETPIEVAYGFGRIIAGIGNNPKARVGASFASQQLHVNTGAGDPIATNDFIYAATIETGWAGDLKKVTVDTVTGAQGAVRWSAATKLDTLLATPAPGSSPVLDADNAWFASRRIVTKNVDSGAIEPFLYANVGATNLSRLGSNATQQQKTIAYLRGGSTFGAGPTPQIIEGIKIGQFRQRTSKLGNISDSKPVIVGPSQADFSDLNDYGFEAFKAAKASRPLRVYVGANDGMFHVFDGTDDASTGGAETFAYIPSGVINNAVDEGGKFKGIRALTFQDGGSPIFKHHFYVNASPKTMDVDFANCGANTACSPDWRTIVVGSLGKGGNTYFAIDATDPNVVTEADAATRVLWEWSLPGSEFSFGKPIIAKTRADGWVVVIASGYNNTDDGKGHLYFLKASDGTLIRKLNTTSADTGTVASPSGLAQISGFTKDSRNQIIEQIYGGDLNGRVWRWDVSDPDPTTWQAKTRLFATLTAPSAGGAQPVTTNPQIEIDLNNGVDRFVFIGTGRLLDPNDLVDPSPEQIQTMYAIRDGTLESPTDSGLPIDPRATLASASGVTGVGAVAPNGWYNDLPLGQRIVNDPQADLNLVAYAAVSVQPDPCLTSLPAYIYARDFTTAESLIYTGGVPQAYYYSDTGAVGLELVALDSSTSSFPKLAIVFTRETNATIQPVEVKPKAFGGGHRLSWRILGE